MSSQAELLVKQVETLNKKATMLNNDRNKKLGMQESAKAQYERAVAVYQQKYGVTLDDTNLQVEYDGVFAKLKEEASALNETILSIENGTWQQAQQPQVVAPVVGAPVVAPVVGTPVVAPVVAPVVGTPAVSTAPASTPTNTPVSIPLGFQQQFVQPSVGQPQSDPTCTQPQANTPTPQDDVSDQPFTPQGWGTPSSGVDLNANFNNILGKGGIKFGM